MEEREAGRAWGLRVGGSGQPVPRGEDGSRTPRGHSGCGPGLQDQKGLARISTLNPPGPQTGLAGRPDLREGRVQRQALMGLERAGFHLASHMDPQALPSTILSAGPGAAPVHGWVWPPNHS